MSIDNHECTGIWRSPHGLVFVSKELIDEIKSFPIERRVNHCGEEFTASSLEFHGVCPRCETHIKLRSFSGTDEFPDLFDAVLMWLQKPGAAEVFERRRAEIEADTEP